MSTRRAGALVALSTGWREAAPGPFRTQNGASNLVIFSRRQDSECSFERVLESPMLGTFDPKKTIIFRRRRPSQTVSDREYRFGV